MIRPYVCATCRLALLSRKQAATVITPRRWLSQSAARAQETLATSLPDIPQDATTQHRDQTQGIQRRSRYSRQILAPQQLLDDLLHSHNEPARKKASRSDPSQQQSSPKEGETVGDRTRIPQELLSHYRGFMRASKPVDSNIERDQRALQILLSIGNSYAGTEGLYTLVRTQRWLSERCLTWVASRMEEWVRQIGADKSTASAPRPLDVVRAIAACDIHSNGVYAITLWHLAARTLEQHHTADTKREHVLELANELMLVWNFAMRKQALPRAKPLDKGDIYWSFLPDLPTLRTRLERLPKPGVGYRGSFGRALSIVLPTFSLEPTAVAEMREAGKPLYDYASAAFVTLEVLHQLQADPASRDFVARAEPWITVVEEILEVVRDNRVPIALGQKLGNTETREIYRTVVKRFGLAGRLKPEQDQTTKKQDTDRSHVPEIEAPLSNPEFEFSITDFSKPSNVFVKRCTTRLMRAVEQQNESAARQVYGDIQDVLAVRVNDQLPIQIYEALLYAFLSLRISKDIPRIFNDMIKAGHQPTTRTYSILMHGAYNVRDNDAMHTFWNRMKSDGLQPDQHAWSTRLYGLLRSHKHVSQGMRALEEMGQQWMTAATLEYQRQKSGRSAFQPAELLARFPGDVNGVPRPNVSAMNAAITALAATNDLLVSKALAWGRSFGIKPNVKTYNVLINISLRHGLLREATKIYQKMTDEGVEPDRGTWTVLLAAMFHSGSMDELDSEQAGERILKFIEETTRDHKGGLGEKSYAMIMDRLLKVYGNYSAVRQILNLMVSKGIKPTAEIYTILMSAYLQQTPPDFAAAESLWARIQRETKGYGAVLDDTFFDRTLELYGSHHATVGTKPMLDFLESMEAQGKRPSFRAMESIARALAGAGEWERLEQFVDRVRRETPSGPEHMHLWGQRHFWNFIASTGL